jgi:hypothetical protein
MDNLLQHVRSVLSITPARWLNLTGSVALEILVRPPSPGEWSAVDCLRHLLDTETYVFPIRVEAFLAARDFEAFDPDAQAALVPAAEQPADLAAEFARQRMSSLAVLARMTPVDLPRTAHHSELGIVSLAEMLHEWAAHDLMHTVQAERAMMQPFIAECGPWRSYFSDHAVTIRNGA